MNALLIAQRSTDAANRWLNDNPLVLALIFLAIGGALIAYGVIGLRLGTARGKYGEQYEGGMANLLSIVRLIGGLGCCGFAIYKLIAG